MRKRALAALVAMLCLSVFALTSCGETTSAPAKDGSQDAAVESAGDTAQNDSAESEEKQYQWDINGDMAMHWETNDDYKQYVQIADEACTIGSINDKPFVSMKAIFPSWEGWPMDNFSKTNITPWHFDAAADLGEAAKDNGEGIVVWGNIQYPVNATTSEVSSIEDELSYYLRGERAKEANEGTLATTGLRTKEINGQTVKYVRMQYEYDHYVSSEETVTLCAQRTEAMLPIETSEGITVYLDVMIDEFRSDPTTLSDDSIIDLIFENVVIEG